MPFQIVIEKYKRRTIKPNKRYTDERFFLDPPMPWTWTLYNGKEILTYGHTHTEEQAEKASTQALGRFRNTYRSHRA
jgi:hypothetical protein